MKQIEIYTVNDNNTICLQSKMINGFPGFKIIGTGLKAREISELETLVRTALHSSGFRFPQKQVVVSITPNQKIKSPSLLQMPVALAVLFASSVEEVNEDKFKVMNVGELNLEGNLVDSQRAYMAIKDAVLPEGCTFTCLSPCLTQAFIDIGEAMVKNDNASK